MCDDINTKAKPQKIFFCNQPNCTLPTVPGPMFCGPQTCEYSPPKMSCDVTPGYGVCVNGVCVNGVCAIQPGKTECKVEPGSWTCKLAATPTCCVVAAPPEPPKKETQVTVVLQQPEAPKPQPMVVYWPMAPMPMMPIQFFQA
ncbi:hypothetical protein EX30DRAFT_254395 [Ascodesmis nigricans]|uniref:Uncharacterized protein n=1 Tax=Ascodesmis nigricans TaxID=341454 RepID=A0A4S2MYA3_9PEZI|nr:hypothetical protein EX30DRAFT_254395 [Ascodesmis nigricans]